MGLPGSRIREKRVDRVEVYGDLMLGQVFSILVDNSIRHGGLLSALGVRIDETEEGLRIIYEDDGTGISEDEKERIFERGYGRNTGLGLFLARGLLTLTGIEIRETGEEGRGARFELRIPKGAYRFPAP